MLHVRFNHMVLDLFELGFQLIYLGHPCLRDLINLLRILLFHLCLLKQEFLDSRIFINGLLPQKIHLLDGRLTLLN